MKTVAILLSAILLFFSGSRAGNCNIVQEIPGAGLILDRVEIDGLEISNFSFQNGHSVMRCHPGEKVDVDLHYIVKSDDLKSWRGHHFLWALMSNKGPSGCLLSSLGLMDREGDRHFSFEAPDAVGVHTLRIGTYQGGTPHQAQKNWVRSKSHKKGRVVGVLIIESGC